ncbi:fimbrial protein [Enterobacter cloacae]
MKVVSNALILATLTCASVLPAHAASLGTITFEGVLTDTTCNVDINGGGPSATVKLPAVSSSDLTSAGQVAGRTIFNMNLTGCTTATGGPSTVTAFFEPGPNVNSSTGRLVNSGGTAGDTVSLQLLEAVNNNYKVINVGNADQADNATYLDISGGTATLPYAIQYYAESATAPGTVTSSVVYNLIYK